VIDPAFDWGDDRPPRRPLHEIAYCQDNELSRIDWEHADRGLLDFVRRLIALRHSHPVFRRRQWFKGRPLRGLGVSDMAWLRPMPDRAWGERWTPVLTTAGSLDEKTVDSGHPLAMPARSVTVLSSGSLRDIAPAARVRPSRAVSRRTSRL
jgi:pullulanase/glycogen debranching enzyme